MPKVYISNFANLNYDHLSEFGDVHREPITVGFVDLNDLTKFYNKIKPTLDETTPDDYLVLSGAAVVGVVISQFWLKHHGLVKLLSFDNKKGPNGGYRELLLNDISFLPDNAEGKDHNRTG